MNEYWKPWVPTRGQRVRVRLSAECRPCRGKIDLQAHEDAVIRWLKSPDGMTGTVQSVPYGYRSERASGHDVAVTYDRPIPIEIALVGRTWSHGGVYAASELEPMS